MHTFSIEDDCYTSYIKTDADEKTVLKAIKKAQKGACDIDSIINNLKAEGYQAEDITPVPENDCPLFLC